MKIKIIDFGIAGVVNRLTEEDLDSGSLAYMAPECFSTDQNHKFDGRMDVWAIGVILFSLLTGDLPFKGATSIEIKDNIKKSSYRLPLEIKKAISKECLNAIFRCLDPNPKTRIKISELMIHEWFSTESKKPVIEKPLPSIDEMAIVETDQGL